MILMATVFSFHKFISDMSPAELERYALKAGTTARYLTVHLIYRSRIPRPEMMEALVHASEGAFTKVQLVHWLYHLE